MDKLRRIQFDEIAKALRPFAAAADRIEAVLGLGTSDQRPVRSGARLTLGDLRQARMTLQQVMGVLTRDRDYRR